MKNQLLKKSLLLFSLLLLQFTLVFAEGNPGQNNLLWGDDVKINDNPLENQSNVRVSVAFNGWIYAAYKLEDVPGHFQYRVMVSKNNGLTFSEVLTSTYIPNYKMAEIDLAVAGNDTNNLSIFISTTAKDTIGNNTVAGVYYYDRSGNLLNYYLIPSYTTSFPGYNHCTIATDYRDPGSYGTPYTVSAVFVKTGFQDSLIYVYSFDGGQNFTTKSLYGTSRYIGSVDLTLGRTYLQSFGRAAIAFEERSSGWDEGLYGNIGVIFDYMDMPNSYYTGTPLWADSSSQRPNGCRRPAIALMQESLVDNDSSGNTLVVLMEEPYSNVDHDIGVTYVYNQSTPINNSFQNHGYIDYTTTNAMQPHIVYDPFADHFLYTYYDSSAAGLWYSYAHFNDPLSDIQLGGNFRAASTPMNHCFPQVDINPLFTQVVVAWNDDSNPGTGVAFFDAEFSTYVGISEAGSYLDNGIVNVYPVPASASITIKTSGREDESITFQIMDITGKVIAEYKQGELNRNDGTYNIDLSGINPGTYLITMKSLSGNSTARFIVQ